MSPLVVSVSSPVPSVGPLAEGNGKAEGPTNGAGGALSAGGIGGVDGLSVRASAPGPAADDASIGGLATNGLVFLFASGAVKGLAAWAGPRGATGSPVGAKTGAATGDAVFGARSD
jgi:hypothetical protein